jgi:hypothetical protein
MVYIRAAERDHSLALEAIDRSPGGSCSPERLTSCRTKRKTRVVTIVEIGLFRNAWQVYESAGVQPVFLNQEHAID